MLARLDSEMKLLIDLELSHAFGRGGTGGTYNELFADAGEKVGSSPPGPPTPLLLDTVIKPRPAFVFEPCWGSVNEMSLPRLLRIDVDVRGAGIELVKLKEVAEIRLAAEGAFESAA
jgi:hypothetical protein